MLAVVEPHRARVAPWSSPWRDPHAGLVRSQGGCTGGATCCFDICSEGLSRIQRTMASATAEPGFGPGRSTGATARLVRKPG